MTLETMTWQDWSCTVAVTAQPHEMHVAASVVARTMAEVDEAVSRFRDDSDLARINARAGRLSAVRPLTLRLVALGQRVGGDTGGAVDPTLGQDLIDNGYDADIATVRSRPCAPAGGRRQQYSWRDITIDKTFSRVGVPAGAALDLGATAKAWTADEAVRRLRNRLQGPVLVSLGGDLAAGGAPDGGWRIEVSEVEGGPGTVVTLHDGALTTSSARGRRWRDTDGAERHHVLDPRTGRPAHTRWRTATVWAPTALSANVLSTWLLVDADAAEAALVEHGYAARLVAQDGAVVHRGGWPEAEWEAAS